jgi:hypothetical protein
MCIPGPVLRDPNSTCALQNGGFVMEDAAAAASSEATTLSSTKSSGM